LGAAAREQPDIILLDLDLGGEDGVSLIPELGQIAKDARILVLTGLRDPEIHRRAVMLGALGIVQKEKAPEVLTSAIERVYAGSSGDGAAHGAVSTSLEESKRRPFGRGLFL
jgi:DNA-binding NarL/FixJ family response regulator